MPEIVVTVKVDAEKLRKMANGHREDQLDDRGSRTVDSVEQIEADLLEGWADEIAENAVLIWPDMMVAAREVRP